MEWGHVLDCPSTVEDLTALLTEISPGDLSLDDKGHVSYFVNYLGEIKAKTIIVEKDYIDKYYLEDYAAYYVRCFGDYPRHCCRLHFFTEMRDGPALTEDYFLTSLREKRNITDQLQGAYLGFIVLKPLPRTVFGRTCLVNYADDRERCFPVNQTYSVNLFGYSLTVDSLAFQEQDTDVAACATSALWSAFQATGKLFQHAIPSPVEITRTASSYVRTFNRTIPNHEGLNTTQIADAIRGVGLEPHALKVANLDGSGLNANLFRAVAYAYLQAGIPCITCGILQNRSDGKEVGRHAITLVGYSIGKGSRCLSVTMKDREIPSTATRIDRLYAHDDGIGPFSRLVFSETGEILTSWHSTSKNDPKTRFVPYAVIIPAYHKIRIPFTSILEDLIEINRSISVLVSRRKIHSLIDDGEWDVRLADSAKLKSDLMLLPRNDDDFGILSKPLPKYVWICDYMNNGKIVIRLVFDATDLLQGNRFSAGLVYDKDVAAGLSVLLPAYIGRNHRVRAATKAVSQWLTKRVD